VFPPQAKPLLAVLAGVLAEIVEDRTRVDCQ
jgi:hypothetical protein